MSIGVYYISQHTDEQWTLAFTEDDLATAKKLASALKRRFQLYAVRIFPNEDAPRLPRTPPKQKGRPPRQVNITTADQRRRRMATYLAERYSLDRKELLRVIERWESLTPLQQIKVISNE